MTIKASEHRQLLQLSQIGGLSPCIFCSCHFRCDDYDDDDGLRRQVVGRQGWLVVVVVVVVVVAVAGTTTTAAAVVLASAPSPAPATARNRRRSGSGGA